jgi:hypothetical protein
MLLDDLRRTSIVFGSEQLVFSKAISYRPSRKQLEPARSSISYMSNGQYGYSDQDYYELKQDEARDKIDLRVGQEKNIASTCSSVTRSLKLQRARVDEDIQFVDSKNKSEHEMLQAIQQEYDELNFKNKRLKPEIEHAENKLDNLRTRIKLMETRESVISNEQWKQKKLELRDRENALILKEVELNVDYDKKLRLNRETMEKERRQLRQKEINIESRVRIEMYNHSIESLQSQVKDELNRISKDQKE